MPLPNAKLVESLEYQNIIFSREAHTGIIQLNRPKVVNALSFDLMGELVDALEAFDKDEEVRAVVLAGNANAFSAGADLKEIAEATSQDAKVREKFRLWERIKAVKKPIIAAVEGFAFGGGCELAMSCDIIVAGETARFGQPEVKVGVMPGAGGTQRLTRAVGKYKAMEMVLTGGSISAREAEMLGLVSRVVPDGFAFEEARSLAKEIGELPPIAIRSAKESVLKAFEVPLTEGMMHERESFFQLLSTEDKAEGIRAFMEKRKPVYRGK